MNQPPRRKAGMPARKLVRKSKKKRPVKTRPVSSSMIKYRGEIGALQ